jgi:hypothetical protein
MNKKTLAIGGVTVAVIAALLIFVVLGVRPASFAQGFSTLSLTQGTSFLSSDQFFNSPVYLLNLAVDGSSGTASGEFTPVDVAAFTGQNRPSGPFTIAVDLQNQTCLYTVKSPQTLEVWTYSTFQYPCTTSGGAYCSFPRGTKVGDVYIIDSVAHYNSQVKVDLTASGATHSFVLSPTQPSAQIDDVLRAQFVGSLQGAQSCPVPSADTVLYRPLGSNVLQPKPSYYLAQLQTIQPTSAGYIDGPLYQPAGTSIGNANQIANNFIGAAAPAGSAYCTSATWSGTETNLQCTPVSPVSIPIIKMYVKASVLGVVVPSSMAQIVSISNPTAAAGNTTAIDVTLKNTGDSQDSFDLSVSGKAKVNVQASRISLAAGEQKTATVLIQGAGLIGNYTLTATSVNDPENKDSVTFRLTIDPYCDRQAEPGKTKVSTEYGCAFVCPGTGSDLRERTCQAFGTFEPKGKPYNRTQDASCSLPSGSYYALNGSFCQKSEDQKDYGSELHCTGIGAYTSLNGYMDSVLAGGAKFVPPEKANAYFLGAPYCNYWAAYGYRWDGMQAVALDEVQFYDVFGNAPSPAQGTFTNATGGGFSLPTITLPGQTVEAEHPLTYSDVTAVAIVAFIVLAIAGAYILTRKK